MDDSLDPVFQERQPEVDEETEAFVSETEVVQKLLCMNRVKLISGFQFHDHAILNDQIRPESLVEDDTIGPNWNHYLPRNLQTTTLEPVVQQHLIDRLQVPRPKHLMHTKLFVHHHP